ncbi:hypothetical protein QYM36_009964 [Artemia franciscana]|uniref:Uncharacterized protein n=1 Tax=Artemia franciscana TaxID=6661 RepID=A0AA88HRX5_ARTSF|nr:hypothetical protein QYM36_009964 [Artemia franciscana]
MQQWARIPKVMKTSWENLDMVPEAEEVSAIWNTARKTSWLWPRERRKVMCRALNGTTKNCIDYALVPKQWKISTLDTVALAGGDFDSHQKLAMASFRLRLKSAIQLQKKVPRFRTELLKNESTRNRYRINFYLAFNLENSSMNPEEIDLDTLAHESNEILIQTSETVLGRTNSSEKAWITDETIQMCKDKCAVANRQDRGSRDIS